MVTADQSRHGEDDELRALAWAGALKTSVLMKCTETAFEQHLNIQLPRLGICHDTCSQEKPSLFTSFFVLVIALGAKPLPNSFENLVKGLQILWSKGRCILVTERHVLRLGLTDHIHDGALTAGAF